MRVIIRETNEIKRLSIFDPKTCQDYTLDFVGNWGALQDGQFEYQEDQDAYLCDKGTFEWWEKTLAGQTQLVNRIDRLITEYGSDIVFEVFNSVDTDLENHVKASNEALNKVFGLEEA